MGVSVQHGIYPAHLLAQGLQAEIWRGVYEDHPAVIQRDHARAACALVARIGRAAGSALAADRGRASTGAYP